MMRATLVERVLRRLDKSLASAFFIDQWAILTARGADYRLLDWKAFTPLLPPKDRYWGDPFVVEQDGRIHVFVEEKLYDTGRGHIACLEVDADGGLVKEQIALKRDHHLSYPFVFRHGKDLYMIPESAERRSVDLYRCERFPDRWGLVKTLLKDIYAVDATLVEHEGAAWLFANVKEDGGSSLNALHVFRGRDLLADHWAPHRANPVVRDLGSARPGGSMFRQDGQLIRPSQDSRRRYGYALRFNRITRLDEGGYREECVACFEPPGGRIRGTHTFNQAGGVTAIDAVIRRRK